MHLPDIAGFAKGRMNSCSSCEVINNGFLFLVFDCSTSLLNWLTRQELLDLFCNDSLGFPTANYNRFGFHPLHTSATKGRQRLDEDSQNKFLSYFE
jgi:hypothetical protein